MSFGDIFSGIQLAWYVWERGFSKMSRDSNANQSYIDFGREVHHLHESLLHVKKIVENATTNCMRVSSNTDHSQVFREQDRQCLQYICGNYKTTLEKCKRLLHRKEYFLHHDGFVYNVFWDLTVEAQVARLQAQIHDHIVKIQSILQPLEFRLVSNLENLVRNSHRDLVNRMGRNHEDVMGRLDRIELLLIKGSSTFWKEQSVPEDVRVEVAPELDEIFFQNAIYHHRESCEIGLSSLNLFITAFLVHFDSGTKNFTPGGFIGQNTPSTMESLSLMKCVWILSKLKSSHAFNHEPNDSMWLAHVHSLEVQLKNQLRRFSSQTPESERLCEPQLSEVLQSPEKSFRIWVEEEPEELPDTSSGHEHMEKIAEMALPTRDKKTDHRIIVLRASANTLDVIESIIVTTTSKIDRKKREHPLDLTRVKLIPLYAAPGSSLDAFNLKVKDEGIPGTGIPFAFKKLPHLLKFQHALTGYYVAHHEREVLCELFHQGRVSTSSRVTESGILQIWIPKKLERNSPRKKDTKALALTESNISKAPTSDFSPTKGTKSAKSLSYSAAEILAGSALPAINRASRFKTPLGLGHLHDKPVRPVIVLYLQNSADDAQQLSFLAIKIDSNTFINRMSCDCRKLGLGCLDSSIEHKSGSLEAARYSAGNDLDAWNVANIGLWQKDRASSRHVDRNLKWAKITFKNLKDRIAFAGDSCQCHKSDGKPSDDCLKEHHGIFGQVRVSYKQKLAEYDNRHNLPHILD